MRRLFQFGAVLMLVGTFYPLLELFDYWDAPGIANDREFSIYLILFAICLVLLLCKLIAAAAMWFGFVYLRARVARRKFARVLSANTLLFVIPPLSTSPLRI